ncbi:medium-chain acyl-CoA ligase ACSF2, mitochondrial-like [Saccostrea echinata]|uniref:medium-chain acyl-CoA ligase ACSF2, mitochondrial-like n=1 Tax=Saccostrea echinata TaxID=191078 RepID=UPI002A825783|nr:medium-chain acyl-CoA ligase ACSF2, mitochondrial-like [Saccostrea echinata]
MSSEFSYLSKPREKPYRYRTITELIERNTRRFPDHEILIHRGIDGSREALTYKDLNEEASKLAKFLVKKGIKKGDKIALFGPNTLEWVIGELAIILAGGVAVHVTFSVTDARDLWDIFREADCKAFLIDPGKGEAYLDSIFQLLALFRRRRPSRDYKDVDSNDSTILFLRKVDGIKSYRDLPEILKMEDSDIKLPTLYPEDEILIFTTSGSTGKPKMVSHSHFDIGNIELFEVNPTEASIQEKTYNDRPFGWVGGSPVTQISNGLTRVFTDSSVAIRGSDVMAVWNIIKEEKCSKALLMPYFLGDLISMKDYYEDDFKTDIIMSGGQIIDDYYTQVVNIFTKQFVVVYGSTEAGFVTMGSPLNEGDTLEIGDVGSPCGGVELKVIDENGSVVPRGMPGELCIRSRMVFRGYFKNEEVNKTSFLGNRWFRSGDTAIVTEDDRVIIQGRIKDIISRGTRKIMPDAVEDTVIQMGGLLHVAVVPVPDKRLYEEVCLCFVPEKESGVTVTDVKRFCDENFEVRQSADGLGEKPTYFLQFDSFPMLDTGKPNKRMIKLEAENRIKTG